MQVLSDSILQPLTFCGPRVDWLAQYVGRLVWAPVEKVCYGVKIYIWCPHEDEK